MNEEAILEVTNIGGILGKKQIKLIKNKLNLIDGANASGKSSIIKGLIAVLGIDNKILHPGPIGKIWMIEATNIGILPERGGHRAGILHASADKGEVMLREELERKLIIERSGKIYPDINANSNFLLVGVLTPNSWLYSTISRPADMRNESIFKNYITKLSSKAGKYEQAGGIVQEYYSKLYALQNEIKRKKAMIPTLKKEIKDLEKEIKNLKDKKMLLTSKIGEDKDKKDKKMEIDRIKRELENLEKEKEEIKKEVMEYKEELEKKEMDIKRINADIYSLNRKLEEIERKKSQIEIELSNPPDTTSINNMISEMQEKRIHLQALADLYYNALDTIHETGETACPLCGVGQINAEHIEKHLKQTKDEISQIERELRELVNKKTQIERYIADLNRKYGELEKEKMEIKNKINRLNTTLKNKESEIPLSKKQLEDSEKELKVINEKISEYTEILRKEKPELVEKLDKLSRTIEEKENLLNKKMSEYTMMGYIDLYGKSIELEFAQKIIDDLIKVFQSAYKYAYNQAERVRKEAVDQFNRMIGNVLKRIGFSEFKKIYLDRDYILNVQYVSPEGEIKIIQPNALSESERVVVSLVLMLALNKVYRESINYIAIDNMYEYLDQYRTSEILNLLSEYAIQEKVTIVLTKTTSDDKDLNVRVYEISEV